MGLKGYRLWAMGQLDSTCSAKSSHREVVPQQHGGKLEALRLVRGGEQEVRVAKLVSRVVAVQVERESKL
jgi:hypothetical protein